MSTCACWSPASRCRPPRDLVLLPGSKADAGRPRGLAGGRAGTSTSWPMSVVAAGCWACAAATRCSGGRIADPAGVEGAPGEAAGLGLLTSTPCWRRSRLLALRERHDIALRRGRARLRDPHGPHGRAGSRAADAAARRSARDGAVSADGRVMGCYLHGLLAADGFRARAAGAHPRPRPARGSPTRRGSRRRWTGWPQHLERCLDLDRLLAIAAVPG